MRRAAIAAVMVLAASHIARADRCDVPRVELHVMEDPAHYMEKVQAAIAVDEKSGALKPNSLARHEPAPLTEDLPRGVWRDSERSVSSLDRAALLKYLERLATTHSPKLALDRKHRVVLFEHGVQDHPDQHAYEALVIGTSSVLDPDAFASFEAVTDASVAIRLTAAGGKAWAKVTKTAIGHRIAVLVDGNPVTDLRIGGQVTSGVLKLYMPTRAAAAALAKRVQSCR